METQKELAKTLKANFGAERFRIQGWNIYLNGIDKNDIKNLHDWLNESVIKLGYKRIKRIEKENGKILFGSVPFGICITVTPTFSTMKP